MSNAKIVCGYCGEGELAGGIVIAPAPNVRDYHYDPEVCRRVLDRLCTEQRMHIARLEAQVKHTERIETDLKLTRLELEVAEAQQQLAIEANAQNVRDLKAKAEYIELLEANLETLRRDQRGLQAALAGKALHIENLEKARSALRDAVTALELEVDARGKRNRELQEQIKVLEPGREPERIAEPQVDELHVYVHAATGSVSWDTVMRYVNRELARNTRLKP